MERNELKYLRLENKKLATTKVEVNSDSSDDSEDDILVEDLDENFIKDRKSCRMSISAEVYQHKFFKEPSFPKTED